MYNYSQLLEKIALHSKLSTDEIERKVEGKRAKLSGLVSKEGAAQIVAAELGINFDQEKMKLSELVEGMKKINVTGKILEVFPFRTFSKNGRDGKVGSFLFADESSNTRVVLWDTNQMALFESGTLKAGDVLEISNAQFRNGEMHLASFSDIKKSNAKLENVIEGNVFSVRHLKDAKPGSALKTRAVIVQMFEPRYFEVCPECPKGKKMVDGQCVIHGSVKPDKRALLNLVLDDGTETIRAVLFSEQIKKLGLTDEEIFSLEAYALKKDSLLGEEKIFSGNIRQNTLYNTTEFTIQDVEEVNTDLLLSELELER